jgi:hypothetical protein
MLFLGQRCFRAPAEPDGPTEPAKVIDALAIAPEPGLGATSSARLTAVWDQNAAFAVLAPAEAALEILAPGWLLDLLSCVPSPQAWQRAAYASGEPKNLRLRMTARPAGDGVGGVQVFCR